MYVTRRSSQLYPTSNEYSAYPDGPGSGFLVLQDDDRHVSYRCFGFCKLCKSQIVTQLPFPQNKELSIRSYSISNHGVEQDVHPVILIPVVNLPLSSNRYYIIVPNGKHKGEAYTCSTEEDRKENRYVDVKPRPLDPQDIYQQFEIVPEGRYYKITSMASDGFPPWFTQNEEWVMYSKKPRHFELEEVKGIDYKLRSCLDFSPCEEAIVVGKWYCPFMFVKEGRIRDQMERSLYYEVTLEQRWEEIYTCNKDDHECIGHSIIVEVAVEKEEAFVGGKKSGFMCERNGVDGVIWFTSSGNDGEVSFGVRIELFRRMKWEEERGGWIDGVENVVKIDTKKEFEEEDEEEWKEYRYYVLVERFNLRRMDGSLAMAYDFKHLHQIRTKRVS